MYGISDSYIEFFGDDAQIRAVLNDNAIDEPQSFEYNIEGVPYTKEIGATIPNMDIDILDATPDKYLVLYAVDKNAGKFDIKKFACVPLKDVAHDKNWLLQYPCKVNIYTAGGRGHYIENQKQVPYINATVDYDSTLTIPIVAAGGYALKEVQILDAETEEVQQTITAFDNVQVGALTYKGVSLNNITKDLKVKVTFENEV